MGARFATILCCELVGPRVLDDDDADVLRRAHLATLRRALLSHEGRELHHTRDGVLAAFHSAGAAIRCAVDMQRACAALGQVSLSTGLDAGEPLAGREDVDGAAAEVAGRLCDAAAPGEILATQVVCDIAGTGAASLVEPLEPLRLRGVQHRIGVARVHWSEDRSPPPAPTDPLPARIGVVVAGPERLARAGLRRILAADAAIEVLGEAADGRAAVDVVRRTRPDVAVLDLELPERSGLEAARLILEEPELRTAVLLLASSGDEDNVLPALRLGVSGVLRGDASAEQLLEAVRVTAAGDALLAPAITRRLIAEYARGSSGARENLALAPELRRLTSRELEVLRLVARGLSNAEIAAELVVAESTVKSHVSHLLDKLGLRDRVQAVIVAYESGLIAR